MATRRESAPAMEDRVRAELQRIRASVVGVHGSLAVYAAGDSAVVAVIGTTRLNVGMLQYQARDIIERVALLSAEASAQARTAADRGRRPAGTIAGAPSATPSGLPIRRRAA